VSVLKIFQQRALCGLQQYDGLRNVLPRTFLIVVSLRVGVRKHRCAKLKVRRRLKAPERGRVFAEATFECVLNVG
jgi:hypothetical protein